MESQQQNKKSLIGLIILVLSCLGLLIALSLFLSSRKKKSVPGNQENDETDSWNEEWSIEKFHQLVRYSLPDVDETTRRIITSQAMHETGIFTSPIFINNNNAFGMKMPEKRKTIAIRELNGYAYYDSVQDSIEDLVLWFKHHNITLQFDDAASYNRAIKEKSYYEASFMAYNSAVTKHLKTLINLYDEKIT